MAQLVFPVHPAWNAGRPGAMPAHQRLPWKPVELPFNKSLGQSVPSTGTVKAVAIGALLLPTAAAAAVSYVGFRLGSKDEGWASILGYVVGALGAVSAVMGLLAMTGVAVTPFNLSPKVTTEEIALPAAAPAAAPAKI